MTQDCLLTPSIASEEANRYHGKQLPKGIHITDADNPQGSASGIEDVPLGQEGDDAFNSHSTTDLVSADSPSAVAPLGSEPAQSERPAPWGYLFIHNKQVDRFKQQMDAYNEEHPEAAHACFVHYSIRYKKRDNHRGIVKRQIPTISGLVFLQGYTRDLQLFLRENYPTCHLMRNCSTGQPAVIPDSMMQPFMEVVSTHPENVTFLRDPFLKFAQEHVRLRILTGLFKGLEGYIVRVDRDRQLIMEFGGYAVAIRGVHKEDFEIAE